MGTGDIGAPPQCVTSNSNQCQGQWPGASFSYNGPQCQCQCQGFSFTHTPGQTQVQPSGLLPDLKKIDINKKSCGTEEMDKHNEEEEEGKDDDQCFKMPKLFHALVLFGPDKNLNGKPATYRGDFHTLGTRSDGGQMSYHRGVAIRGSAVFPGISIGVDGGSVITGAVTQPKPHKMNWNKGLSAEMNDFQYNLPEWLKWVDDIKSGARIKV